MTRLDPFTHAFAAVAEQRFSEIRDEATATHRDPADRPQFGALRTVQHLLADIESPDLIKRDPDAADEYLNSLWAAYRFWCAGRTVIAVPRDQLIGALAAEPPPRPITVPGGACYFQLPERWFWAQIGPAEPHEPVDGIFVVQGAHGREVAVLAVLGLRADRPGFSQISVIAATPTLAVAHEAARTPPFAPVLDGGDSAGLRSLVSTGEVLHLAQLVLTTSRHAP